MSVGTGINQRKSSTMADASAAPEDVFLAWLVSRPRGADIVAAASCEIIRLEAHAEKHAGAKRLHDLFCALIEERQGLAHSAASRVSQ